MTENREPYHLSGKPRPTTRIAPTNYAETARGKKVKWLTMKNLGQLINRHAADLDPHKGFSKLAKLDLVILDDVGYFDVTVAEANGFLALIEATYQHTSLAITPNSHPSRFADLMPQVRPTQINAAID